MRLVLGYPPTANLYWRKTRTGKVYVSDEARQYRITAALSAKAQGAKVLNGLVVVRVDVFRPAKRGDLDNTLKVLLDALRGVAYEDDKQVVAINAYRRDDPANPRVELVIEEVAA